MPCSCSLSRKAANDLVAGFAQHGILKEVTAQTRNRVFVFDQYYVEKENYRPNLSLIRTVLFWDTNIHKIDWTQQRRAVIERIFERAPMK